MKIIIALLPAALLLLIMYFTNLYTARESLITIGLVFVGSLLWLLIILWVNKISKRN